ncbi:MAG: ribulose-phosphate 3-epimerase [Candidatus Bathyarchaeia archaeon]
MSEDLAWRLISMVGLKYSVGASLLSADFSRLLEEVKRVEEAGVDFIHFDVIDTSFANYISFGSMLIESLRGLTDLPFDVHCYIMNPMKCVENLIKAGANSLSIHLEMTPNICHAIDYLKRRKVGVGVALLPETPPESLEYVLEELDAVTVVGIDLFYPGEWRFMPSQVKKIEKIRRMIDSRNIQVDLRVDGGVTLENAEEICKSGANVLVVGSALFHSEDMARTVRSFKQILVGKRH